MIKSVMIVRTNLLAIIKTNQILPHVIFMIFFEKKKQISGACLVKYITCAKTKKNLMAEGNWFYAHRFDFEQLQICVQTN